MADQIPDSAKSDMSWIDIAVLRQKRGVVIVDYAPGWSTFMDELHFADAIDGDEPDHLAPGAYRWTGFTIGSWQEGDRCVVKGGTFTRAAPPAMDREAVERLRETVMEDEQLDGVRLSHSDALSILSALSADAIRQGEGIESTVRLAVWNAAKKKGVSDEAAMATVEAVVAELPATPASHASDGGKA